MRALSVVLLCVGLVLGVSACQSDDDPSPSNAPRTSAEAKGGKTYEMDPMPAPDLAMETLSGEEINLSDQQGKVILVNFWATWCAPCRKEIPDLIDLQSEMESEGLLVVGIAVDEEGKSVVQPFVEKQDVNYPIVIDTTRTIESHFEAMYGLPTTYVINPEGQIVRRVLGIFPVEDMKPTLKEMLAEDGATT
jgi:peroxiredoxin